MPPWTSMNAAQTLIDPGARLIERLVVKNFDHPSKLTLGTFAGHPSDETDDPWHGYLTAPST